jgi:hypothetical protein
VGVILSVKDLYLGVMAKLGDAAGHHVVEAGRFSGDPFVCISGQFSETLVTAECNAFGVEEFIGLLVNFTTPGVDPVNHGLLGPEVDCVFARFIGEARSGVVLNSGAFGVYPRPDSVVQGVGGCGDRVSRKFGGRGQ